MVDLAQNNLGVFGAPHRGHLQDDDMASTGRIITIGLSPAWDVSCRGRGLDWGQHLNIDEQVTRPAGKALNVSMALAWMGHSSIAAGLWGREDYDGMERAIRSSTKLIRVKMSKVKGRTRKNVTVVDTRARREMHLRQKSALATPASVSRLRGDLGQMVREGDYCVFAGAMPGGDLLDPIMDLVRACRLRGARIVVDSYGPVLRSLVDAGLPWLVAPNAAELGELLGSHVKDTPAALAAAAGTLLEKVPIVLISRGRKGAVLVTKRGTWAGAVKTRGKVLQTVGCGDYLLASFLASHGGRGGVQAALETALKVATAHAWGWTEHRTWAVARRQIKVEEARI
jgi:1-phosphofructokinase family hexose kinase